MKKLHPFMLAGTGSDVGKSIIATALCRILKQDGYTPAPFKAQNMALNSYVTKEGAEIGRAQAVQAEAAGIPCHTDMNPVLLKPNSDHTSQVVLNGRPIGNANAYNYFRKEGKKKLKEAVQQAYNRLQTRYNPIVMEGAGSICELNLAEGDIVNMSMARYAGADIFLVADIDRGGIFASAYGTVVLQKPEDRERIKGLIINKFRGDLRLFESGRKILEQICGIPVLGVIPYYKDIYIEEEDSVDIAAKAFNSEKGKINIAVVLLRHISNFTDFNTLERDSRVRLFYTSNKEEIQKSDIIIIPGTKSTIADLIELRRNGVAQAIINAQRAGKTILGICGGFQILGAEVLDPNHIEGDTEKMPGLALLPISTTMEEGKVTKQLSFTFAKDKGVKQRNKMQGYEIHSGITIPYQGAALTSLFTKEDGADEGVIANGNVMGTYIHGCLDNAAFIDFLLSPFADKAAESKSLDYHQFKELQYNKLAEHVRGHLDMKLIYKILSND